MTWVTGNLSCFKLYFISHWTAVNTTVHWISWLWLIWLNYLIYFTFMGCICTLLINVSIQLYWVPGTKKKNKASYGLKCRCDPVSKWPTVNLYLASTEPDEGFFVFFCDLFCQADSLFGAGFWLSVKFPFGVSHKPLHLCSSGCVITGVLKSHDIILTQ